MYYLVGDNKGRGVTRRAVSSGVPHSRARFGEHSGSRGEVVRRLLTTDVSFKARRSGGNSPSE